MLSGGSGLAVWNQFCERMQSSRPGGSVSSGAEDGDVTQEV
eukprot:COSAG01_NODE_60150_length_296_cov_0.786802_1_plen_40_part_10